MFDPEQLLGQMLGGAIGNAFRGRNLASFAAGSFRTDASLGLGLLGIAVAAFEHSNSSQPTTVATPVTAVPPPAPKKNSAVPPPSPIESTAGTTRELPVLTDQQQNAVVLIRAMIAAANADGNIDASEREKILNAAEQSSLSAANRNFFETELSAPFTLEQILALKPSKLANEIYAASVSVITPDSSAEREYLDKLAAGLGLADSARAQIHLQLGTPH